MWPFSRHPVSRKIVRVAIKGKFDAAQTAEDNRRHWANADNLSPDSAATASVRATIRNRARYEVANNSYARGMLVTLANDAIGTGPRLQMLTKSDGSNQKIERAFQAWSTAIRLPAKLRTMRMALAQDGEAFAMLIDNAGSDAAIKLDVELIEADQIASPFTGTLSSVGTEPVDGIEFDSYGNPRAYYKLATHPGANTLGVSGEYKRVFARDMLHLFRVDRPGQHRGLPEIMPALPLFAQLRRYTLAVLTAAETAANIAVLMESDAPTGGDAAEVDAGVEMEMTRNMAMFMPEGWKATQLRPEQPTTTYIEFRDGILNEIARCLSMPFNVAAGNSSGYNYASGRLDHQTYFKAIRVMQSDIETVILDRIFAAWIHASGPILGLSQSIIIDNPHQWFWDGTEHVDPAKEANAQATRLGSNTTTLAAEYAKQGKDWETELRQRAKETLLMAELGLTPAGTTPGKSETEEETEIDDETEEQ